MGTNETGLPDGVTMRGQIELVLKWHFNPKLVPAKDEAVAPTSLTGGVLIASLSLKSNELRGKLPTR